MKSRNLEDQRKGRSRNEENRAKRQKVDGDNEANGEIQEQQEEGEKEERRPKRKVAVLVGYCGHGYKGMQLNPPTKTIEGDLFEAFVKAGAISRANSNDPKKACPSAILVNYSCHMLKRPMMVQSPAWFVVPAQIKESMPPVM